MIRPLIVILALATACSRPTETKLVSTDTVANKLPLESTTTQTDGQAKLPDFVKNFKLPDSLLINVGKVLTGDFNADGRQDFASLVTNLKNGFLGVIVIHNNNRQEYFVFGAGQEINRMKNLDWIDEFRTIPQGQTVAPTLVDEKTGDIIGDDKTKEFRLKGEGLFMHVDEADGGGILFWKGDKYEWYHIE